MGSLQNYLKQKLNSHLLRTDTYTRPTTLYLALFTTKPDKDWCERRRGCHRGRERGPDRIRAHRLRPARRQMERPGRQR